MMQFNLQDSPSNKRIVRPSFRFRMTILIATSMSGIVLLTMSLVLAQSVWCRLYSCGDFGARISQSIVGVIFIISLTLPLLIFMFSLQKSRVEFDGEFVLIQTLLWQKTTLPYSQIIGVIRGSYGPIFITQSGNRYAAILPQFAQQLGSDLEDSVSLEAWVETYC